MDKIIHELIKIEGNVDYLTGLMNRRGLSEAWKMLSDDKLLHCIYLDVDNFKCVNDIYGHSKGDELLVYVSNLLRKIFVKQIVIRLGGDEFVIICDGTISIEEMQTKLSDLQDGLDNGDFDATIEKFLSFSIGVSWSKKASVGKDEIMQQCDEAMYYVKKHGKGNYISYDQIREEIEEQFAMKDHALAGLAEKELEILYRPIIYVQTSDVYAIEAVVRWNFPGRGIISSEKFVPVLKQYGILPQIDAYIFEEVCRQKKEWMDTELGQLDMYVKLSEMYLLQKNSIGHMMSCMEYYHMKPEEMLICIEESDFSSGGEKIQNVVQKLIKEGFQIVIDNFASASSLMVLQHVPSQVLKLDSGLLEVARHTSAGISILRNVISLGRDLHQGIVAQGIENAVQIKMLAEYGAQFGVGDFYGKPCDADTFVRKYEKRLFVTNSKQPAVFSFRDNLSDDKGVYAGEFIGTGLTYTEGVIEGQKALHFPGGGVKENVVHLPKEVMYSDSYSICFWVNPDEDLPWTSIFYIAYMDGFMSVMPASGHEDLFYRIKDDREANEWHDLACRKAVPGQWSYVCITYDVITGIAKLYFNGLLVRSLENVPNLKVVNQIVLGGDEYQNSYKGMLAGLEIYYYVLSAGTIEDKFKTYQREPSFLGTDGRK